MRVVVSGGTRAGPVWKLKLLGEKDKKLVERIVTTRRIPVNSQAGLTKLFFFLARQNGQSFEDLKAVGVAAGISPGRIEGQIEELDNYGLVKWDREKDVLIIDWEVLKLEAFRPASQLADPDYRFHYAETEAYLD